MRLLLLTAVPVLLAGSAQAESRPVSFNRDIRPILSNNCFYCHGPDPKHRQADLRLDTEDGAKADLGGYFAIEPKHPEQSSLVERIQSTDDDLRMPPKDSGKELTAAQKELLVRWIREGAKYEQHWSYIPPAKAALPEVRDKVWPANAVDRFILARLEAEGLKPSPEAARATLLRRLSFDLIGLPPTPEEVAAFVNDQSPDAWEKQVDQLLRSPHYGERLAMYWLDLVRYASTVGYHGDQEHAILPYRDYVIKSFIDNKPFDQFTAEQLAGDQLPGSTTEQKIASGYNRLLQTTHEGGAQDKEYLAKYAADRVRNFSEVWLGATFGCAECHDHKFDPIKQADFYSLQAFFADLEQMGAYKGPDKTPTNRPPEIDVLSPLTQARIDALQAESRRLKEDEKKAPSANREASERRFADLQAEIKRLQGQKHRTMISVTVAPREIRLLNRGDWMDKSGPVMQPLAPSFLPPIDKQGRPNRLDLARWLTAPDNPLTARVFVNRLWYLYFGNGLSNSLDDLGSQGEWPTHPELLDWLAVEFRESGWNVKHMVKLLVMSRSYRQSSLLSPESRERDPDNRLYARQSQFRLPAEIIRDNALSISGLLVDDIGGSNSRPYQPAGYYEHLNFPTRDYVADADRNQYRRGIYMHWQRQFLHPMLKAFDAPTREECTARRPISNTPAAALALLNDPTFVEAARVFAEKVQAQPGAPEEKIQWAWRRAVSRPATPEELQLSRQLYDESRQYFERNPQTARQYFQVGLSKTPEERQTADLFGWAALTHALLNLNETITRN